MGSSLETKCITTLIRPEHHHNLYDTSYTPADFNKTRELIQLRYIALSEAL